MNRVILLETYPMRRSLAILVLGVCVVVLVAQPAQKAGKNYAFLVGVSGYAKTDLRPLPFTPNDVEGFKEALLETGYQPDDIVVMHDRQTNARYFPLKKHVEKELNLVLNGLREADTLVVALSGHGVHFKGDKSGYFCPLDAKLDDKSTLLPMDGDDGLFDRLKKCKAKKKLLLVNACRNDPASDLAQAARKVELDDDDKDEVPEGIAALYSCQKGEKSYYDPDRKRGIFFDHLIRAWKGEYDGGRERSLDAIFEHVITKTKSDANRNLAAAQVPVVRREFTGRWVIDSPVVPKKPELVDSTGGALSEATVKRLQKEWATYLKTPAEVDIDLGGGEKMTFLLVPPGRFMMGASDAEKNDNTAKPNESPRHQVEISQPMYVSKYTTTRGQFRRFAAATSFAENGGHGWNEAKGEFEKGSQYTWKDPGFPQTDAHPVVNVSWQDAQKYCAWLVSRAQVAGFSKVRLLREAEWEYCCRAGTVTRHYLSDDPEDLVKIGNVYDPSGKAKLKQGGESIKADDGFAFTSPAGRYRANGFGLHDMIGNVWQWCEDGKREYTSGKQTDPDGGRAGEVRMGRGGSFFFDPRGTRAALRDDGVAGLQDCNLGFRVVLVR